MQQEEGEGPRGYRLRFVDGSTLEVMADRGTMLDAMRNSSIIEADDGTVVWFGSVIMVEPTDPGEGTPRHE